MTQAIAPAAATALTQVSAQVADLVRASKSPNTLRAYASALRTFDASGQPETDSAIAEHIAALAEQGRAVSSVRTLVAALRFRAESRGVADPVGRLATAAVKGYARTHSDRGRGQAPALDSEAMAEIAAKAEQPRKRGRGMESAAQAAERATEDRAIVGLLFHAGLRRSEVAALEARDVSATAGGAIVQVRKSKANQDGSAADVRFVKNGYAKALLTLAAAADAPSAKVIGGNGQTVGRRFAQAAKAAGYSATAHSGRVTLASELTRRGASTTETQLAGGWATPRMVAHYAAGARAERGAVNRLL